MSFGNFMLALTVILGILKIAGVLAISWWLVLAPVIFSIVIFILLVILAVILKVIENSL